ncbi:hypothetical protein D3C85_1222980 [compost metagenome]
MLKHHPDIAAHDHWIHALAIDVLPEEMHMALETKAFYQIIHPVEAAQHRALAAARRTDEPGDLVFFDRHMAVTHGHEVAVENLVQLAVHDHRGLGLERGDFLRR